MKSIMENEELLISLLELDEFERKQLAMFLIASTLNTSSHQKVSEMISKLDIEE